MIFPTLNAYKFIETNSSYTPIAVNGFVNNNNTLYAGQRAGVMQSHFRKNPTRNVVANNSVLSVQFAIEDTVDSINAVVVEDGTVLSTVALTWNNVAGDYYDIEIPLEDLYPFGKDIQVGLEINYYDGDYDSYYFISENLCVLGSQEHIDFYTDPFSFGMAYKGDENLYNGYYWSDYQVLNFKNVRYVELSQETDDDKATTLKGEDKILKYYPLKRLAYRFHNIPEYLYDIMVRAFGMPELYVKGLKVTLEEISESNKNDGLITFTVTVKEADYKETYSGNDYINYLPDSLGAFFLTDANDDYMIDDSNNYAIAKA